MKKSMPFIELICFLLFLSCSPTKKAEKVAEKALKEIGSGKYIKDMTGVNLNKITLFSNSDIFDNYEIQNYEASKFSEKKRIERDLLMDAFFNTDVVFDHWELIEIRDIKIDLWRFVKKRSDENLDLLESYGFDRKETLSMDSLFFETDKKKPQFEYNDSCYKYLDYKDVPVFILKYKLDNKYIATINVVKHPNYGYKVTFVNIIRA